MSASVPYVVGQWVRGERFYGRRREIAGLLDSSRRCRWIAGLRRIGKTSLLRQLDLWTGHGGSRHLPLFWDLQGVDGGDEMARGFADALLDAEELLGRHGIALSEVEDEDLFASLDRLTAALRRRGSELLLLCDEVDGLIRLARTRPELVCELWRAVLGAGGGQVVLASTVRLCDLAAGGDGAAALVEGFGAPLYLGAMPDAEARSLVAQSQLPAGSRPAFAAATVEAIRESCGNHPMLLQLLAKRCLELGCLEEALRQVAADRAVEHVFAVDFELLAPTEREVLRAAAAADGHGGPAAVAVDEPAVRRLLQLGLLRNDGALGLAIPNRFFAAWLRRAPAA